MKKNLMTSLALAGALSVAALVSVSPVVADAHALTAQEAYEARKAAMRALGGQMRGLNGLEGDDAVAAADLFAETFGAMASLFPEDSITGDSKALPAIWEDFEGFEAIIAKGIDASAELQEAAAAMDQDAFAAAAAKFGPLCGECHSGYRGQ